VAQLCGTGPGGRIIERDVQAALAARPRMTPLARAMVARGGFIAPPSGSGVDGRVTAKDLAGPPAPAPTAAAAGEREMPAPALPAAAAETEVERIPLTGVRRIIAERMLASLQTTAQLTLNASADARSLLDYRKRLKASPEAYGLRSVTINDLILFAISRTLPQHPDLNALFVDSTIERHADVHLAVAVDTPRGLVVPVIRNANRLSLQQISREAVRLAKASQEGRVSPDELNGGTFTVTNLGSLGIENFTPILNPPQVAILGVGNINLKPVEVDGEVAFIPHLGLSLTINHQVVDGAPGARFLQSLSRNIAELDLLLAV
jgi:pyruvate dehydrogenase E2 component (dihydrolipoamide acetyltransferase)